MQVELPILGPDELGAADFPFFEVEGLMCECDLNTTPNTMYRYASPVSGELAVGLPNVHQILSYDERILLVGVDFR